MPCSQQPHDELTASGCPKRYLFLSALNNGTPVDVPFRRPCPSSLVCDLYSHSLQTWARRRIRDITSCWNVAHPITFWAATAQCAERAEREFRFLSNRPQLPFCRRRNRTVCFAQNKTVYEVLRRVRDQQSDHKQNEDDNHDWEVVGRKKVHQLIFFGWDPFRTFFFSPLICGWRIAAEWRGVAQREGRQVVSLTLFPFVIAASFFFIGHGRSVIIILSVASRFYPSVYCLICSFCVSPNGFF